MKYIKKYENINTKYSAGDVKYLTNIIYRDHPYGIDYEAYILSFLEYYNITKKQAHNLKLALEYGYLDYKIYKDVLSSIINDLSVDYVSSTIIKKSFETNFKDKIIKLNKPYDICLKKHQKHKLGTLTDLYNFDLIEIIGYIPSESYLQKKYLVGIGTYRGENNDGETLWEEFRDTKRESEFIKVLNEDDIYILNDEDKKNIEIRYESDKYNL